MNNEPTWLVVPSIYRIEWYLLGTMLALSLLAPTKSLLLRRINGALHSIASRRRAAIMAVIAIVLLGRMALMPQLGIPKPAIADEFGYLLTADTFVHGRMTNATVPMWKSFQTFHVFQVPTYQSQYPIGYPAVLAVSQWLLKEPWWAVYAVTALMCGAITWMLQGWLSPYWAFIGGLFAALRFGLFSYWMNSFWGGSLAALGGCLVFGVLPRMLPQFGRWYQHSGTTLLRNSVFLGIGLAALATTRPYEGFVLCLPAAAVLMWWLVTQRGGHLRTALTHLALPCALLLGATLAIVCYYQYKVTGHALESPYTVAARQYHVGRPFIFQKDFPMPRYDYIEFQWIYLHFEAFGGDRMHDVLGFFDTLQERFKMYWQFYTAPLMTLPLLAIPLTVRDRKLRLIWITLLVLAVGVLIESWIQPHYIAPGFCLYVLVLLQGIRHLRSWHVGGIAAGRRMVRALPALCVLLLGIRVFAFTEQTYEKHAYMPENWARSTWRLQDREELEERLNALPGQHLVIVRYRMAFHNVHHEVVYNFADFATSKILWARSAGAEQNCALVKVYGRRNLWVLDHWGEVYKLLPEDAAQICDPQNPIYEVNQPREYYFTQKHLRLKKPAPVTPSGPLGSSHAASSAKGPRASLTFRQAEGGAAQRSP